MSTIAQPEVEVTGGVDTHRDTHTAAALDGAGRVLGSAQFPATAVG
jgi:transposase